MIQKIHCAHFLHSHDPYTYTYRCRNIFDTIRTSEDTSLEKYTSHFIERVVCERWVGDWTELQNIDPHSYGHNSVSFLFSEASLWDMVLIPASSLQLQLLNWGLRAPSAGYWFSLPHLFSNWLEFPVHRVISLFYVHSIQPVDSQGYPLDTFDRMHLLFTQVHFIFWQLGRGQYATHSPQKEKLEIIYTSTYHWKPWESAQWMWSKADKSKVRLMAIFTRCWAEEPLKSMARIK